jgi:hypothetical protein
VTPADQRRVRLLDRARESGNVAEACRNFGVSRTRYYEWESLAEHYGLEALMPKARRTPSCPTPPRSTWWPWCDLQPVDSTVMKSRIQPTWHWSAGRV